MQEKLRSAKKFYFMSYSYTCLTSLILRIGIVVLLVVFFKCAFGQDIDFDHKSSACERANDSHDCKAGESYDNFLLSTPQIENPLWPLQNIKFPASSLDVKASVVAVADPLETRLGRAFDVQVSSLIRAYHAMGFVLDRFALTWKRVPINENLLGRRIPDAGTGEYKDSHRSRPSVLVFRKDLWRDPDNNGDKTVKYRVLFLVGESPTFGLHPVAFDTAINCAAKLNQANGNLYLLNQPCTPSTKPHEIKGISKSDAQTKANTLYVIGPSFSGSMTSLADSVGTILNDNINVSVISPTATVFSNQFLPNALEDDNRIENKNFKYQSMAESLWTQLQEVCIYADNNIIKDPPDIKITLNDKNKILVFAEESTFGRGVIDLINQWRKENISNTLSEKFDFDKFNELTKTQMENCFKRIRVVSFPQNISAIRAERSQANKHNSDSLLNKIQPRQRMLNLDFSTYDESTDRPPAYLPEISSRSDELMLYHTFDALRVWVKPVIVTIVATDVRDRLFMLNEVRKSLPASLPVLLEMDYLTAHPDYRKISRGALVIPHGPTLLCLAEDGWKMIDCQNRYTKKSYFSFPSDYAANMFRAVYCLLRKQQGITADLCTEIEKMDKHENRQTDKENVSIEKYSKPDYTRYSRPRVSTLAGFQSVGGYTKQSSLLAADSRLALQWIFLGFLIFSTIPLTVITIRLLVSRQNNLVMVSLLRGVFQWLQLESNLACTKESSSHRDGALWNTFVPLILLILVLSLSVLIVFETHRIFFIKPAFREWSLAHGRDFLALLSLFFLYAWIAIRGGWRLNCLLNRHGKLHRSFLESDSENQTNNIRIFKLVVIVATLILVSVFALTLWLGNNRRLPTTVDPFLIPLLINCTLLALGVTFLIFFYCQAKKWLRLANYLARTIHVVNNNREKYSNIKTRPKWPSPMLLAQDVQSPFGLTFRFKDLVCFNSNPGDSIWIQQTQALIKGEWPFSKHDCQQFLSWQDRLVAEMRFASTAVRNSVWCGVLAPITLLVGMSVYPPVGERLITTASIGLIVIGFALIMFVALKVEQNPLLSRMFTIHGDRLTFIGAVGALWPKLFGIILILIPILFPGALEWVFSLMKSINSL